jgi:hypothetical protein
MASLFFLLSALPAASNTAENGHSEDLAPAGYAYSTILGSGYYDIAGEQLFIIGMPFSWESDAMREAATPWRVLLPVSAGLTRIDKIIGSLPQKAFIEELQEEFSALSLAPGIEWTLPLQSAWIVKPRVQLGLARDFKSEQTAYLAFVGSTARRYWDVRGHRVTWGNGVIGAFQQLKDSGKRSGLVLIETGVDYDFNRIFSVMGAPVTPSVFVLWQHFANDLDIGRIEEEPVSLNNMVHLGMTIGFREERSLLGIPYQRIGLSLVRGDNDLKAVSLNLGFWL